MKRKKKTNSSLTGWELKTDENLFIKKDSIYKALKKIYPLIDSNLDDTLIALVRKSSNRVYGKPTGKKHLMLLTIYSQKTWRHFYLPQNQIFTNIKVVGESIIISTLRTSKKTDFTELNNLPIFFDQTEENRRLFFDGLRSVEVYDQILLNKELKVALG